MENENDMICLQELKAHFKNFSPDVIEEFYYANEKNISITFDSLIAYEKFGNINKSNKKNKKKKKKHKKKDLTHMANFEVVNNNENINENIIYNNNGNISENIYKKDYNENFNNYNNINNNKNIFDKINDNNRDNHDFNNTYIMVSFNELNKSE